VIITLSQLAKDASNVPAASHSSFISINKPTVVLKRFFGNSLSDLCLRHLQSFPVAVNEQVQNIKKSKASVVELVLCFATVKARIQQRQSDVHSKPS